MVEFDCLKCGVHVSSFLERIPTPALCDLCLFMPNLVEREDGRLVPRDFEWKLATFPTDPSFLEAEAARRARVICKNKECYRNEKCHAATMPCEGYRRTHATLEEQKRRLGKR